MPFVRALLLIFKYIHDLHTTLILLSCLAHQRYIPIGCFTYNDRHTLGCMTTTSIQALDGLEWNGMKWNGIEWNETKRNNKHEQQWRSQQQQQVLNLFPPISQTRRHSLLKLENLNQKKKKLDRLCFFSFWTGSLSFSLIMEALYSEMIRVH